MRIFSSRLCTWYDPFTLSFLAGLPSGQAYSGPAGLTTEQDWEGAVDFQVGKPRKSLKFSPHVFFKPLADRSTMSMVRVPEACERLILKSWSENSSTTMTRTPNLNSQKRCNCRSYWVQEGSVLAVLKRRLYKRSKIPERVKVPHALLLFLTICSNFIFIHIYLKK